MPLPPSEPAASPELLPELLVVGRLVAAQGLGGELRVLPLSDFPERFTCPGPRWLQTKGQPPRPVQLRRGRQLPGRELFVVQLDGVDSRTAAEALVGQELLVPASDRPALEPGEFHLLDLVGLEVRLLTPGAAASAEGPATDDSRSRGPVPGQAPGPALGPARELDQAPAIGTVCDLIHAGNDLLEVELPADASQEHSATTGGDDGSPAQPGRRRRILIPFVEAIVPVVNLEQGWLGLTPPPGLLDL